MDKTVTGCIQQSVAILPRREPLSHQSLLLDLLPVLEVETSHIQINDMFVYFKELWVIPLKLLKTMMVKIKERQ